jgi:two-component system, LytTR family, sensor histidine kinase AlgZ
VTLLLRILLASTASAALFTVLVAVAAEGGRLPVTSQFVLAFLYAGIIGAAAQLVLPRVAHRLSARAPLVYWTGVGATLALVALAGSLVAALTAQALGVFGPAASWPALRRGMVVSLVITLGVGLVMTLYETVRARLADTREVLRQRELEVERAQRLASEARLASLESRLHPHFVFNAIAAIAGRVREAPEHAERLLIDFAGLLRASLETTSRHTVPLADELDVVRAYLEIEQARLGDRLRTKLDVPDELLGWPVPPFALHTLVQNSIKHVVAARAGDAEIRVAAGRVPAGLALTVWDDGPGVDLSTIPAGHGLDSLRSRAAVLFGAGAALQAGRDAGGARVTLVVPASPAVGPV